MPVQRQEYSLIARTFSGLEDVLADELRSAGAGNVVKGIRAVFFTGDKEVLYRANYRVRTAISILKKIGSFPALNENDLYKGISEIKWEELISPDETLAVDAVVKKSAITHSKYAALKTKDAVVDRLRNIHGRRPDVNVDYPDLNIFVHINANTCTVSINSSGELLHMRKYRRAVNEAPLNESLAAGLILLTGWDKKSPFYDPMCGSGTFLIEAMWMAKNIPPGDLREQFGFEKWRDFDAALWHRIKKEENSKITEIPGISVSGSDISPRAVSATERNLLTAGLSGAIPVKQMPFEKTVPDGDGGIVILNPPYGERLVPEDINALYKQIGDRLKSGYAGATAWILTHNKEAAKHIGLHPSRKITVYNGALECKFMKFEMYEGSRKAREVGNTK
jgi:putative N6-adenine-specific DNA methylase